MTYWRIKDISMGRGLFSCKIVKKEASRSDIRGDIGFMLFHLLDKSMVGVRGIQEELGIQILIDIVSLRNSIIDIITIHIK